MLLTRLVAGNARGTLWFFPQLHRQYRKPAFEVPIAELLNPDFNLRIEQPLAPIFSAPPLVDFSFLQSRPASA